MRLMGNGMGETAGQMTQMAEWVLGPGRMIFDWAGIERSVPQILALYVAILLTIIALAVLRSTDILRQRGVLTHIGQCQHLAPQCLTSKQSRLARDVGLPGGGRASQIALQALAKSIAKADDSESLRTAILDGIENANEKILADETCGGTTLAVVELFGRVARPYHVGDSLILVTGQRGRIKAQAVPHSPVGYAFESGLIDEWEAMVHEERHIVDNMVGSESMRIEIGPELELADRDTLLIASDGLFDNLFQAEIVELIRKGALARASGEAVKICQERMVEARDGEPSKPDDLTLITFRVA